MKLTPKARKSILDSVDILFETTKARLLGRFFKGPAIFFEVITGTDPLDTIEGMFKFALTMLYGPGAKADEDHIQDIAEITGNYIDSHKLKVKNKILDGVKKAKNTQEATKHIKNTLEESEKYISMLVANEGRVAQAYAERSGISQIGADIGVDDPIVCKLGVIDSKMCANCRKLWHSDDNVYIPKVYKLSELRDGYMKVKKGEDPYPTIGPSHPNCRHTLTMVPPDFGFDEKGYIRFKSFGYDAYKEQKKKK